MSNMKDILVKSDLLALAPNLKTSISELLGHLDDIERRVCLIEKDLRYGSRLMGLEDDIMRLKEKNYDPEIWEIKSKISELESEINQLKKR